MADPTSPTTRLNLAASNDQNRLMYACDAGILSDAGSSDNPNARDLDSEDSNSPNSDSDNCKSPRLDGLAACFHVFSDSLVRMELAEMEMIRARETSRWEAEKRRMELESELTRMMLGTQLQIASVVAGKGKKRKRIQVDEDESAIRDGALLLSLLQCNFSF